MRCRTVNCPNESEYREGICDKCLRETMGPVNVSVGPRPHRDDKNWVGTAGRSPGGVCLDALSQAENTRAGWEKETAGGMKFDADKPLVDLIDADALEELAKVLTFGAKKYAPHNWRKGISYRRLIAAAFRHLLAIMRGEDRDLETGLPHAAHLMCCAMFLIWNMKHKPELDDRWKPEFDDKDNNLRGHNHGN